jgi:hypothetical protein
MAVSLAFSALYLKFDKPIPKTAASAPAIKIKPHWRLFMFFFPFFNELPYFARMFG